jgi:hypothetical protein
MKIIKFIMEQLTIIRDQVWGRGGEISNKGLGFLYLFRKKKLTFGKNISGANMEVVTY